MVYPIAKKIFPPIISMWIKEVNGLENVPKKGPFIIAANHASYMDHLIISSIFVPYLDKKVFHLSKKEYFEHAFSRIWHRHWGAIPIDRQKGGKKALKWAVKALKQHKVIVIHPEGTRTLTGKLLMAKTGVARLALSSKSPVIPVGLIGTFEMLPKGKYIPKFKRAVMNIGKPMHFEKYYNKKINKRMLREATTIIMKEIARLSHQKYNFK